ncbi:MAG: hypothetical protein H6970_08630 [Gammaproteobacteria bacterium]|nr:hypothetical protein [Gammaproteobacteria bacterium]MCP5425118.1 hypothetical protein [Gammaproteobacteria bacterium]MCP5459805.1 hypothetical protein [Gammaproteobacteria bacterium]
MELWMLLLVAAFAWLIAPIILFIALILTRNKLKSLEAARTPSVPATTPPPPTLALSASGQRQALGDLENLVLLRLELQRHAGSASLDEARHRELIAQIDAVFSRHLTAAQATPDSENWRRRRQIAWNLLTRLAVQAPGTPPWREGAPSPAATPAAEASAPAPTGFVSAPVAIPPAPVLPAPPELPPASTPVAATAEAESVACAPLPGPVSDWKPTEPGPLERLFQRVSGWPRLAVPFLLQNIGWFVGAFCLLAGTVFLVRNTSGFSLALVVFASMLAYTGFLLWAGYQLRVKQPDLITASSVLLAIGLLLAPLDLAAAARLIAAAATPLGLSLALALTGVALAAFYWAASLVSALMDRTLTGAHPRLVVALASMQLLVPWLDWAPQWQWLAGLQGMLLAWLGYGLHLFARRWLRSWFVEQRSTAYYAGGVLVYAAAVSFVHLTWAYPGSLPAGYFGPFLMALCGLLFQVDAAFKEWIVKYPLLSRFSFALYGLSVVAAALGLAAVIPGIMTLSLGAVLYGWVTWRYLTLPPLYLMLACVSGAYGLLVLEPLPFDLYLLASLPGLLGLLGLIHWARTRSRMLALQCLAVTGLLLTGLTGWSLYWAHPGWTGLATPVIASAALYWLSRRYIAPLGLLSPRLERLVWCLVTLLATVAAFYAPVWPGLGQRPEIAGICIALSVLWTWSGLRGLRRFAQRVPVFLASAWLNVALALVIVMSGSWEVAAWVSQPLVIPLLFAGGGVFLWQSLALRRRALFYAVLLCWGGAGVWLKQVYFPAVGTGLSQFLVVLPLWALLWWLNARPAEDRFIDRDPENATDIHPLARFFTVQPLRLAAVVRGPLGQALVVLWLLGLVQLAASLWELHLPLFWPWSAAAGVLASGVVLGYFRRLHWIAPVPLSLALGASLGWLAQLDATAWFCPVAALFAWLVWWVGLWLLNRPLTGRLAHALRFLPSDPGGNARSPVERGLYGFMVAVSASAPPLAVVAGLVDGAVLASLGALAISLGCFAASGWHYRLRAHSYAVVATLTAAVWLLDAGRNPPLWIGIGQASANAVLSLALAVGAWLLERPPLASSPIEGLYRRPLNRSAIALALFAVVFEAFQGVFLASGSGLGIGDGVVLLGAGGALLLANRQLARFHWSLLGVFLLALASYGLSLRLWIGQAGSVESGLVLAGLAFVQAGLANRLDNRDEYRRLYGRPLYIVASLAFIAGLTVASLCFLTADAHVPVLLVALSAVLPPLLKPLKDAPMWRSIGVIPLLSGACIAGGLLRSAWPVLFWGYGLWLIGRVLLPRFNARFSIWSLAETPWPWCGLVVVASGVSVGLLPMPSAASYALGIALYLLMMMGYSASWIFPWTAVASLTLAGLLLGHGFEDVPTLEPWPLLLTAGSLFTLLWLNAMLLLVAPWRRFGPALAECWRWWRDDLDRPLYGLPVAVLSMFLLQWLTVAGSWVLDGGGGPGASGWSIVFAVAFTLSLAHGVWLRPGWLQSHMLLLAVYILLVTLLAGWSGSPALLPPLSGLAGVLVLLIWRHRRTDSGMLTRVVGEWVVILPALTILLVLLPDIPWATRAVTLVILAPVAALHGWWQERRGGLVLAWVLPLAAGYVGMAAWAANGWQSVLPWAALFTMAYAWLLIIGERWLRAWLARQPEESEPPSARLLREVLAETLPALPYVPAVLLAAHTLLLFSFLLSYPDQDPAWLFGRQADAAAAITAFVLLLGMTAWLAWRNPHRADWVYGSALLGLLLLGYIRLIAFGISSFGMLDSGVLIAVGFATVVLQRLTGSLPIQRVALCIPLLALVVLPPVQAAWRGDWTAAPMVDGGQRLTTSGVLLAVAVLYIALSESLCNPLPVYLGVLALNAGIYLWVPQWARESGLWQCYVLPAAVTVLALLHWHRHELRPAVLNGGRLAALSVLYASVAADGLRQQNGLGIFVLALGLNLLGVVVGIALRIRAFLYTGVAFLVLNVGGQLLPYYPEQGLARALVLIAVGVVVTVGMVGFNLKREAIMRRVRIIRADLADWA